MVDISNAEISDTVPHWLWDRSPMLALFECLSPIPEMPHDVLISSFQQYVFRVDIYFQQYVSQSWTIIDLGINKFSGQYPRE